MLFYQNHHVLFTIVAFLCCITGGALTNGNTKRNGARSNNQMCLESFHVHNDKIIRTQDSREMGAIYLNVTDVDSREECLKFCCDTERCDVFIFEEKKPGSCYLFQCGSLYDFKCKFTNHANYSSAVRTNYARNNPRGEEVVQISQQEHELKSLRKPVDSAPADYQYTEVPPIQITTTTPVPALAPATPPKKACTRNQFQCRSTGECIAIYNVCDGIAQCADGSDEPPDMICSTEKPTAASSVVAQGPQPAVPLPPYSPVSADITKYQPIVEQRKPLNPLYSRGLESNPRPWELPAIARQAAMAQPGLVYPAQPVELPPIRKGLNQRYQWAYQPVYEQNNELYNPANTLHAQNNFNNYDQNQPHIFNHKGPGVMGESETDNGAYLEMGHPYAGHLAVPNRETWQENQGLASSLVVPNVQYKPNNEAPRNETTTAIPCEVPHTEKDIPARTPDVSEPHAKSDEKYTGKQSSQEKPIPNTTKSETKKINHAPVKAQREHKSIIVIEDHGREHGGKSAVAEHLQQESEIVGLRPKGAVISLALGLTVTAITAALIACRLRVVKKRGRRGHGPYAHDPDYLVNGMYL